MTGRPQVSRPKRILLWVALVAVTGVVLFGEFRFPGNTPLYNAIKRADIGYGIDIGAPT